MIAYIENYYSGKMEEKRVYLFILSQYLLKISVIILSLHTGF